VRNTKTLTMKLKLLVTAISLTTTLLAFGQDSTQLKRTPYKLAVAVDKKTVYEEDIKATPYVLPNKAIQLYPGETVFIEVEQENGVIKSVTAVDKNVSPDKTLIINFTQSSKKKVHELSMLKIENPFSQDLIYTSKIFLLHQHRWVDTNVYPVRAKLTAFETWPDIITSIALGNWEFKSR
jgi:hypothetical protein